MGSRNQTKKHTKDVLDQVTELEPTDVDSIDPSHEKALVRRLDAIFLVVGFLGYTFKYLDQTNISNAYVSGMQTDLKLYGNELNYFTTFFNIGYMVMLYPSCIIISHIGPAIWLPTCEVLWGVFTCCLSTATSAKQVYGLRFLIGFCEGATWPGYFTIISQWYLPHEMALRMSLYNMAQPVGAMLSGALQGALSTNLNGTLGRSGWQWAFLINGICTITVALLAYIAVPGFPERQNPLSRIYLKTRHIETALARTRRVGRSPQVGITPKTFLRALKFWHLWLFSIAWCIGTGTTPTSYFNLWLKSLKNADGTNKYSVAMLNYLPIIGQAIQLVAEILFSGLSDFFGTRLPFLLLHAAINITSLIILVIRPSNETAYMVGCVSTMLLCAWATAHLETEPQVRTVLFATGTLFSYLLSAFLPIAAYPADEAPHWRIGAKLYLALSILAAILFVAIYLAFRWEKRTKITREGDLQSGREHVKQQERVSQI
ncbi:MFS general substrate transporter [Aspergillus saccharolyticus JOP 1030-1]|uniref:MFS general substrate transporter n=1 Tax=Aspergillus saccharolyticus JOP 1030-1 TaxID=1450539 RepID=A0A318Z3D1_9EURO|nr:MFS general substrate transporter [Aspergillus saccharolyticus JOP 1030-1]PYH41586.1 MFS general substrate transporter [Aspergillus saccharolyticus JOP 1030-1]